MADIPPWERRGRDLLDVLDRVRKVEADPSIADSPFRRYLEQASYVQAVCWIAACLADALHTAHAHGLLHMDVKPSNVLIADDGLPVLLDFHLAHRPMAAGERVVDRLGGTRVGWRPSTAPPWTRSAAGRSSRNPSTDVPTFALGSCFATHSSARKRGAGGTIAPGTSRNSRVTTGLADIVDKCTAENAASRYGDAGALADDLRRDSE